MDRYPWALAFTLLLRWMLIRQPMEKTGQLWRARLVFSFLLRILRRARPVEKFFTDVERFFRSSL